jgi:hypothetical protein
VVDRLVQELMSKFDSSVTSPTTTSVRVRSRAGTSSMTASPTPLAGHTGQTRYTGL